MQTYASMVEFILSIGGDESRASWMRQLLVRRLLTVAESVRICLNALLRKTTCL